MAYIPLNLELKKILLYWNMPPSALKSQAGGGWDVLES